jgi:nicotinamidase-related amidase
MNLYSRDEVLQLAERTYRSGQAGFELALSRTALLVIDMQAEFVEPGWTPFWVPAATDMLPKLAGVLAAARQVGMPVIHTAFAATHQFLDRPASGNFMPNRYPDLPANPAYFREAVFAAELAPLPGEVVIYKPSYGAFYDTPLDTILRNLNCHSVIITGTLTNLCCGMTARQAYERGYRVVFGADLTATHSPAAQDAELATQRYGFSRVMHAAEILDWFNSEKR